MSCFNCLYYNDENLDFLACNENQDLLACAVNSQIAANFPDEGCWEWEQNPTNPWGFWKKEYPYNAVLRNIVPLYDDGNCVPIDLGRPYIISYDEKGVRTLVVKADRPKARWLIAVPLPYTISYDEKGVRTLVVEAYNRKAGWLSAEPLPYTISYDEKGVKTLVVEANNPEAGWLVAVPIEMPPFQSYSIIHYVASSRHAPEAFEETHDISTLEEAIEIANRLVKEELQDAPLEQVFDREIIIGFCVINARLDELVYSSDFGFNDLVSQNGLIVKTEDCMW